MKPTKEQLNDPKWWDEYAKEGFDYIFFNKNILRIEFANEDGVLPNDNRLIVNENAWVLLAERPTKPAFVPEVGVECEFNHPDFGWTGCTPIGLFRGNMVCAPNGGGFYQGRDFEFRPIKSERELFVEKLAKLGKGYGNLYSEDFAGEVYDSGLFCLKEPTK